MSSGFDTHGIRHLSASSLNAYAAQPALWVMERLLGYRPVTSALMERGKAAEWGVHCGLCDPDRPVSECQAETLQAYDRAMALSPDPRREHERTQLPGYVEHALTELRQYGKPTGYQEKIAINLPDVPVPIIGYIDWCFGQHGMLVDLKTSEKHPSAIGASHGRQGAVYAAAKSNHLMRFAYAKPAPGKKDNRAVVVYEMSTDEARAHLDALRHIALRLERFLKLSNDARELAGICMPDFEHFYWANPTTRAFGREAFGF